MTNRDVTGNTANCSFYVSAAPSRRLPIPLKAPAGMPPGWGFLLQSVGLQRSLDQRPRIFHSAVPLLLMAWRGVRRFVFARGRYPTAPRKKLPSESPSPSEALPRRNILGTFAVMPAAIPAV